MDKNETPRNEEGEPPTQYETEERLEEKEHPDRGQANTDRIEAKIWQLTDQRSRSSQRHTRGDAIPAPPEEDRLPKRGIRGPVSERRLLAPNGREALGEPTFCEGSRPGASRTTPGR